MRKSAKNAKFANNTTALTHDGQITSDELRSLPQAPEAERSTLGALLMSQDTARRHDTITRAYEIVTPDDYYSAAAREICTVIYDLFLNETPVDLITVAEELRRRNKLEDVGGAAALTEFIESCPCAENVAEYADIVRKTSYARRRLAVLSNGLDAAWKSSDPRDAASEVIKGLQELNELEILSSAQNYSTDIDLDDALGALEWLWPGWILRGLVTIVVARQEVGKSNVALDLCRRIVTGDSWPDGSPTNIDPNSRLLWIDTEMALAGFLQRIKDWKMPRGHFILPADPLRQLQLDRDADWRFIEGAVARYQPPLVVIDSFTGSHRGEEKDNDSMKGIFLKLAGLAQTHKIAIVVIHHVRKSTPGEPDWPITLDMIRGAGSITQFCRTALGLGAPNKTSPDDRRIDVIKSNFARKPEPLGFTVHDSGLVWGRAPEPLQSQRPIEAARAYLLQVLQSGPRLSSDLIQEVVSADICCERTCRAAIQSLQLKRFKEKGKDGRWFVALPTWKGDSAQEDSSPA